MSALLLPMPFLTALDNEGRPVANARLYFYVTDSTNNATVYTTTELTTPHDQPVLADAAGRFPAIYLEHSTTYRAVLKDQDGHAVASVDPLNPDGPTIGTDDLEPGAVTLAKCDDDLLEGLMGFPKAVNRAGVTMDGELRLDTTREPYTVHEDTAGYVGAPTVTKDSPYTLGLADAGRVIRHASSSDHDHTVPPNSVAPFPVGTLIGFRNVGSGIQTIVRDPEDVLIRYKGTGAEQDWHLAQHAEAWIVKDCTGSGGSPDVWYVSGLGLS